MAKAGAIELIIARSKDILAQRKIRPNEKDAVLDLFRQALAEPEATECTIPVALDRAVLRRLVPRKAAGGGKDNIRSGVRSLLVRLAAEGLVTLPNMRLPPLRNRDLALPIASETMRLVSEVEERVMSALLDSLSKGEHGAADGRLIEETAVLALLWFGPCLFPHAQIEITRLKVSDYDAGGGWLRIPLSYSAHGGPEGERARDHKMKRKSMPPRMTPTSVRVPTWTRIFLNRMLISRAKTGVLLGEERLFPLLAETKHKSFAASLGRRIGDVRRDDEDRGSIVAILQRCARAKAILEHPPCAVAILSGRLVFDPADERSRKDLREEALLPQMDGLNSPGLSPAARRGKERFEGGPLPVSSMVLDADEAFFGIFRRLSKMKSAARGVSARMRKRLGEEARMWADRLKPADPNISGVLVNRWLLFEYLAWALGEGLGRGAKGSLNKPATLQWKVARLLRRIDEFLGERPVTDLSTEDEWHEWAVETLPLGSTAGAKKLLVVRVESFHKYLLAHAGQLDIFVPAVDWNIPELRVFRENVEYPVILPWQFDAVVGTLRKYRRREAAESLEIAALLAYYAGLRRVEVCALRLMDLLPGSEGLVAVTRTKTASGRRLLPLRLLTPAPAYARFRELVSIKMSAKGATPETLVLATPNAPDGYDPKSLSDAFSQAVYRTTGRRVGFHSFRHAFASFFVLRWFVARYGRDDAGMLGKLLETDLFAPSALESFMRAVQTDPDKGRLDDFPVQKLSIMMGHSGPVVTCQTYVNTLNWLAALFSERADRVGRTLNPEQAAAALLESRQMTHGRYRKSGGRRGIPIEDIVRWQGEKIARRHGRTMDRADEPAENPGSGAIPADV